MSIRNLDLAVVKLTVHSVVQLDRLIQKVALLINDLEAKRRQVPGGKKTFRAEAEETSLDVHFHVGLLSPPSGGMRSHHRPLPRRYGDPEAVLPRLKIVGSAYPKTLFLPRSAQLSELPQVAEDIPRSHEFTRTLHSQPNS